MLKRKIRSEENEMDVKNEDKIETAVENWRGLGESNKDRKRKKPNYLDKDPTVLSYNIESKTKSSVIGILRNGNSLHLKPIRLEKLYYSVINTTCGFDSIIHIMCCCYVESRNYANFVDTKGKLKLYELIGKVMRSNLQKTGYNFKYYSYNS